MVKKLEIGTVRNKKILAVGAHPDDLEVFAGGTLALLSGQNRVTMLIATDGSAGNHDPKKSEGVVADVREKEAGEGAKILGVNEVVLLRYPDLELRSQRRNFFKKLLKLLVKFKPDIIISWDFWGRYEPFIHPDHRTAAEVVMEARLEAEFPGRLRKWGVFSPALQNKPELWLMAPAEPNYVVDITASWETKWQAIRAHVSQTNVQDEKSRKEKYFAPAGKLIGVDVGEAFRIVGD